MQSVERTPPIDRGATAGYIRVRLPAAETALMPGEPSNLFDRLKRLFSRSTSLSDPAQTATTDEARTGATPQLVAERTTPALIGRYEILEQLGQGGMGSVYKARDPQLDRFVALKVPYFEGPPEKQAVARLRFLREARAAARVRHPHVCPIHDVGEQDGVPYVVMSLVEGCSLADHLRKHGRLNDCREAACLAAQIADALQAVHAQGILHRDLKPGNILLDSKGQALLADFGLARFDDDADCLTAAGVVVGTPAYMAPEQRDPSIGPVDVRTDLYSLGVVLYQMLTGMLPRSAPGLPGPIKHPEPAPPSAHRADIDPHLEAVVLKAMSRDPAKRFANAAQLAASLNSWLASNVSTQSLVPETRTDKSAPTDSPERAAVAAGQPAISETARANLRRLKTAKSRGRWMKVLVGTACLLLVVCGYALIELLHRGSSLSGPEHASIVLGEKDQPKFTTAKGEFGPLLEKSVTEPEFKGWIDIRIWDNNNPFRQDVRLPDFDALPLKLGDLVRVEARLNRPGYVYILWIDAAGKVHPVHPWQAGEWNTRPDQEHPVERLDLPDKRPDNGWSMTTTARGMETLLMLVATKPLEDDEVLKSRLVGLPVQKEQKLRAAVWFENGEVVRNEKDRAPSFELKAIDDPVLQTQQLIKDKLQPHFAYTRAVSFAYQGK
jgi:serine/threonine protein kinase